jgi:hypothetical protein
MKCAVLLAAIALGMVGCSQKQEPPAGGTAQKPGEPAAGPPPNYVAAAAQNAPAENVTGEVNAFLTEQLRLFIREKGRMPTDFAELARTRLDSVPRPPAGTKWVIDKAAQQVKAVANR